GDLSHKMVFTCADNVAAKGHPRGRRTEIKPVRVARQFRAIAGEQIDLVALRTEGKPVRADVKISFAESFEAARPNDRARGNHELLGIAEVVAQEPTAD